MKKAFPVILLFGIFINLSGQSKFVDRRDGSVYRTITLSGITWMAENLKYKAPAGAYYFDNNSNNKSDYGLLYEWKAAKTSCPSGWRLPSGTEFRNLINLLEQNENWEKTGNDTTSFGIQLGGFQDYEGIFSEIDETGYYWTSTEYDKTNAEYFIYMLIDEKPVIDLSRKEDIADIHGSEKSNKYSVRCLRN